MVDGRDVIAEVTDRLAGARSALFITGAGISADSGLPTYRGVGGLYNETDTDEGIPIEVALSGQMLRDRPDLCWKYIHQIEQACRGREPNRGHRVIAELEARLDRVVVLTQNVDGFHHAAGSSRVIDIHGDIHRLRCIGCDARRRVADYADLAIPPACDRCGALVRPEVVLFGEMLPEAAITALRDELVTGFDIVFSVGTTSVFPYIMEPVVLARRAGRPTVEINPGRTEVSDVVDHKIAAGAADALDAIAARLAAVT